MLDWAAAGLAQAVDIAGAAGDAAERSAKLFAALCYAVILIVILAFGCWALLRSSRRQGERLRRGPPAPTAVPDVWSMHQAPDDVDAGGAEEEPDHGP